jgi:hypothetical protein
VEQDYSQVAQSAPQSHLASGLAEAFRSSETLPFGQMLGTLFGNSNGQQRAGILNKLLDAAGPGVLASGGLSSLAGLLGGGNNVTPEQANQIPTETVQQLAEHAEKQNPSIVESHTMWQSAPWPSNGCASSIAAGRTGKPGQLNLDSMRSLHRGVRADW